MILLLNGPPSCGKDTIANILLQELAIRKEKPHVWKFAEPLVGAARAAGFDMAEEKKNELQLIGDRWISRRQFMIELSEEYYKPRFGQGVFGKILRSKIEACDSFERHTRSYHLVSDSGFAGEAAVLLELPHDILRVQVTAPDTSFDGDSRSHWSHPSISRVDFHNKKQGLEQLRADLQIWLDHCILETCNESSE